MGSRATSPPALPMEGGRRLVLASPFSPMLAVVGSHALLAKHRRAMIGLKGIAPCATSACDHATLAARYSRIMMCYAAPARQMWPNDDVGGIEYARDSGAPSLGGRMR